MDKISKEHFSKSVYHYSVFMKLMKNLLYAIKSGGGIFATKDIEEVYRALSSRLDQLLSVILEYKNYKGEPPPFPPKLNYYYNVLLISREKGGVHDRRIEPFNWQEFYDNIEEYFDLEEFFINDLLSETVRMEFPFDEIDEEFISRLNRALEEYLWEKKQHEDQLQGVAFRFIDEYNKVVPLENMEFSFINNEKLHNILMNDFRELREALARGLYKTTIILCFSMIEGLITYALILKKEKSIDAYNELMSKRIQGNNEPNSLKIKANAIDRWPLPERIEIAYNLGVIDETLNNISQMMREYRNLIHPYSSLNKKGFEINENTAKIAVFVLSLVNDNVRKWANTTGEINS